jgi:hypothetical protein
MDGALWFVSETAIVRMTAAGVFSAIPLPPTLNWRTYPEAVLAPGGRGTMWVAQGADLYQIDEHGIHQHYRLPDATLHVKVLLTGCDGSLYVAEDAPELLRLRNGKFERYTLDMPIDGLTSRNCTVWFINGTNMPDQHVGTLWFEPIKS